MTLLEKWFEVFRSFEGRLCVVIEKVLMDPKLATKAKQFQAEFVIWSTLYKQLDIIKEMCEKGHITKADAEILLARVQCKLRDVIVGKHLKSDTHRENMRRMSRTGTFSSVHRLSMPSIESIAEKCIRGHAIHHSHVWEAHVHHSTRNNIALKHDMMSHATCFSSLDTDNGATVKESTSATDDEVSAKGRVGHRSLDADNDTTVEEEPTLNTNGASTKDLGKDAILLADAVPAQRWVCAE